MPVANPPRGHATHNDSRSNDQEYCRAYNGEYSPHRREFYNAVSRSSTTRKLGPMDRSIEAKSLVPYRQRSASKNLRVAMLVVRSAVDTAICSKPLARWMYGDWMPPAES